MSFTEGEWAVVELMGHQRALGLVTEVTIAGAGFLRIDTPEHGAVPASSRIVSPSSIYAINPTTREALDAYWQPRAELPRREIEVDDDDNDDDENDHENDEPW